MGSAGESNYISRCFPPSLFSPHRTNSPPHTLKILFCFSCAPKHPLNQWSHATHYNRAQAGYHGFAYTDQVSYPGTSISPVSSLVQIGMESEKPAGKSLETSREKILTRYTQDELVGQRWGKVESALLGRRRSHSPTAPRCLRTARYGRTACDLRRTDRVPGWHQGKRTYKRKRNGERGSVSSRTAEYYL